MIMVLNIKNADKKIAQLNSEGHDVYWDNYTIVSFRPNPNASQDKFGVFRNGKFGYEKRFEVTTEGLWHLHGFKRK